MKKDYPNGMKACGADALRLALLQRVNLDDYIALDYKKVLACRQLANKIWQAARFVLPHGDPNQLQALLPDGVDAKAPAALWQAALQPTHLQAQYHEV
jgi:valyl-tRNA synthetase